MRAEEVVEQYVEGVVVEEVAAEVEEEAVVQCDQELLLHVKVDHEDGLSLVPVHSPAGVHNLEVVPNLGIAPAHVNPDGLRRGQDLLRVHDQD